MTDKSKSEESVKPLKWRSMQEQLRSVAAQALPEREAPTAEQFWPIWCRKVNPAMWNLGTSQKDIAVMFAEAYAEARGRAMAQAEREPMAVISTNLCWGHKTVAEQGEAVKDCLLCRLAKKAAQLEAAELREREIRQILASCVKEMKVASVSRCVSSNFDTSLAEAESMLGSETA